MKQCTGCDERKNETEFYRDKRTNDGWCYKCKECMKSYQLERYWEFPQAQRERKRIHYHNNIDAERARNNAKRKRKLKESKS